LTKIQTNFRQGRLVCVCLREGAEQKFILFYAESRETTNEIERFDFYYAQSKIACVSFGQSSKRNFRFE